MRRATLYALTALALVACLGAEVVETDGLYADPAEALLEVHAGVDATFEVQVVVANLGTDPVRLTSVAVDGADWVDAIAVDPLPTLEPGDSIEVTVRADPAAAVIGEWDLDLVVAGEAMVAGRGCKADVAVPTEQVVPLVVDVRLACDLDGDGVTSPDCGGGDCDDDRPQVFPGAEELCDGLDNDCDGTVDESDDGDGDGVGACQDCDDADPNTFPGALEICDGLDNDCNDKIPPAEWDYDEDGFAACEDDCNDNDPTVNPGALDTCDGLDNDCDGVIDPGCP